MEQPQVLRSLNQIYESGMELLKNGFAVAMLHLTTQFSHLLSGLKGGLGLSDPIRIQQQVLYLLAVV